MERKKDYTIYYQGRTPTSWFYQMQFLSEILEDDDQVNIKLVKLKQKIIKIGIETLHLTSVGEYFQNLKGVPRNNMG